MTSESTPPPPRLITCEYCGATFPPPPRRRAGPDPKYCRRAHRQRAYEERRAAPELARLRAENRMLRRINRQFEREFLDARGAERAAQLTAPAVRSPHVTDTRPPRGQPDPPAPQVTDG